MRNRRDPGLRTEELFKLVQDKLATIVDGGYAQLCAFFIAKYLPGHDVGVMLHGRDQDFVARANVLPSVTLRHQVDGFGGSAHEYDFFPIAGVEEALRRSTDFFVIRRRTLGKR